MRLSGRYYLGLLSFQYIIAVVNIILLYVIHSSYKEALDQILNITRMYLIIDRNIGQTFLILQYTILVTSILSVIISLFLTITAESDLRYMLHQCIFVIYSIFYYFILRYFQMRIDKLFDFDYNGRDEGTTNLFVYDDVVTVDIIPINNITEFHNVIFQYFPELVNQFDLLITVQSFVIIAIIGIFLIRWNIEKKIFEKILSSTKNENNEE